MSTNLTVSKDCDYGNAQVFYMLLDIWSHSSGQLLEDGQCLLNLKGKENTQKLTICKGSKFLSQNPPDDSTLSVKATIITKVAIFQPLPTWRGIL